MKDNGERDSGSGGDRKSQSRNTTVKSTLSDLGITRDQSSKWQKLAELPEEKFEARLNQQGGTLKPSTAELIAEAPKLLERVHAEATRHEGKAVVRYRVEGLEPLPLANPKAPSIETRISPR
jgi:hypothetical protein